MYSSTLPSTSALDAGGWSTPRPGRFTPHVSKHVEQTKNCGIKIDYKNCASLDSLARLYRLYQTV